MLVLVDYQRIPTSSSVTLTIVGLYNTDDGALYYYKPTELLNMLKRNLTGKEIKIKGLEHLDFKGKRDKQKLGTPIVIEAMDGIGFLDIDKTVNKYYVTNGDIRYEKKGKLIYSGFAAPETVFTKPMKIARYTSSMSFWYMGVKYRWQENHKLQHTDKLQTTEGLNIEATLPWKPTKNYFYIGKKLVGVEPNITTHIKTRWPAVMTNSAFIDSANVVQQFLCPITSFYRCNLPYCESLDLTGLNMQYVTRLRNCFWKSKTLKRVNMGNLDLSNILDIYWAFQDDTKLEVIDFRSCKGDIQIDIDADTMRLLSALTRIGETTLLLLNKGQTKFARLLHTRSGAHELVNVKNLEEAKKSMKFVNASSKLMTNKIVRLFFVRI